MKVAIGLLVLVFAISGLTESVPLHLEPCVVPELLTAPSYQPAAERLVHIAGGFFSCFEGRHGSVTDHAGNTGGDLSFELDELYQESQFLYAAKGTITVHDGTGHVERYTMHRLDYVQLPDSDQPAYRLGGDGATLVVIDAGSAPPCLTGEFFVMNTHGYERFAISMRGRDESEAERHLWQRIRRLTTSGAGRVSVNMHLTSQP